MDYIEIQGYKSIKKARIELQPINILIGANGSGKSNFLSFFEFLSQLFRNNLNMHIALKGGSNKFLHKGKKNTKKISFEMAFNDGRNGYAVTLKSGTRGFIFLSEQLIYEGEAEEISQSNEESNLKYSTMLRATYISLYLDGCRKYHFHDTSESSPFSNESNIKKDTYYLYSDGANLAAFLYRIQKDNSIIYQRIVRTIQSIAPYFSDFYLIPNKGNYVSLRWKDKYSDFVFDYSDLSDGTLRFIALCVLFLQPKLPYTIIIDEPELGLHPTAIGYLAEMIQSASEKGCQVIVATQSTDLIDHFSPEDIITVDQINGETQFNRLSSEKLKVWLDDYSIGDLWKQSIISEGQPNYRP